MAGAERDLSADERRETEGKEEIEERSGPPHGHECGRPTSTGPQAASTVDAGAESAAPRWVVRSRSMQRPLR